MSIINVEKNGTQYTVVYAVEPSNIKGFGTWAPDYYPIWWYVAPTIINTFLEAYDFSGKKIVLFATSGGSGFGKAVQSLQKSVDASAEIVEGKVFRGSVSEEELKAFVETMQ